MASGAVPATAQTALKTALRDSLGPEARLNGYRGSSPTWRKQSAAGDWAVVNIRSSSWSTSSSLRCVINISAAPEPWLRWWSHHLAERMPKSVGESLGLYRQRLHPARTPPRVDGSWEATDESSAFEAAGDMAAQLREHCWGLLDHLLTRDGLLEQIRVGDLGKIVLPTQGHNAQQFDNWVRGEARKRSA